MLKRQLQPQLDRARTSRTYGGVGRGDVRRRASATDLRTGSRAPSEVTRSLESEIGAEVRKLRKELDLTVAELGTAAGISTGMLSKTWSRTASSTRGRKKPAIAVLCAAARGSACGENLPRCPAMY